MENEQKQGQITIGFEFKYDGTIRELISGIWGAIGPFIGGAIRNAQQPAQQPGRTNPEEPSNRGNSGQVGSNPGTFGGHFGQ